MKNFRKSTAGLTLVEVLITIFILSVGVMSTLLFFTTALTSTEYARDVTIATTHSEYLFEEMRTRSTLANITDTNWADFALTEGLNTLPSETINVVFVNASADPGKRQLVAKGTCEQLGIDLEDDKMKLSTKRGFTLVESMVSILVFALLVTALFTCFSAGNSSWAALDASVQAQREARQAMITISKELRQGGSIAFVQSGSAKTLSFDLPSTGAVSYRWDPTGTDATRIIRTANATSRVVASNISAFNLTNSVTYVILDITASIANRQGNTEFNLRKKIALR